MPDRPKSTPPSSLAPPIPPPKDLDAYSEATRRWLYDATVAVQFPKHSEDPDVFIPTYTPDEAGLVVFFCFGRWVAVWQPLEDLAEPFLPPDRHWVVVTIAAAPEAPYGVAFHEV